MNKKLLISVLVCIGLPVFLCFFSAMGSGKLNWTDLGLAFFLAGFLYLLPGFIMALVKTPGTKDIGKGMLLASALLLLVGFSICSYNPVSFH